jgi:ABC-type glycerol-3-phosphate transport system substrate-binding protein
MILRYRNKIYTIPYTVLPELTFKQTYIQEGELYLTETGALALPFNVDPLVMYWNRDIFNNAGLTKPPANWTEVSDLAIKLTQKDRTQNILRSGVALGEFRNVNNAKEIISALLLQAGNPIIKLSSAGEVASVLKDNLGYQKAPAISALNFFTIFSNPTEKNYSWNRSLANSLDVFANGDLAIYFGLASDFLKIKNKNPNLNFAVASLPQIAGAKTYQTFGNMLGLAIMKDSANPAGTYTVLSSLTSADAVPFWKDILNLPSARRDILGQTETNAIKAVFNDSAVKSKGWLDPNNSKSSAIFQEMIESYTTGRNSLDQAISLASDRLDSLLINN